MLHATTLIQYPLTRWLLAMRLQWSSALRVAILRSWNSACRQAERPSRVVPYY